MKKLVAAAAAAAAVLVLAALSGVALAGDHHGGGDHGSAQQQQGHDHGQGQTPESAQQGSTSSDQQAGVKPSNNTYKDQTCTTGGGHDSSATCQSGTYPDKSDSSKRYGNGKTAAQIANDKGAPAGTQIYGPGNSQPHKICGRDVHAYKGGDCSKQEHQQEATPPPACETASVEQNEQGSSDDEQGKSDDEAKHESDEGDDCAGVETSEQVTPPAPPACETASVEQNEQGSSDDEQGKSDDEAKHESDEGDDCADVETSEQVTPPAPPACETASVEQNEQGSSDDEQGKSDDEAKHESDEGDDCAGVETTAPAAPSAQTPAAQPATPAPAAQAPAVPAPAAPAPAAPAATTAAPAASGSVLGASKALTAPASKPASAPAGVLGVAKTLGSTATSGTLPFTGLRLWIVELIALGLIGSGVAMRLIARRRTN